MALNEFARRSIRPLDRGAADHAVRGVAADRGDLVRGHRTRGGVRDDRGRVPVGDAGDDVGDATGAADPHAGRAHDGRRRLGAVPRGDPARGACPGSSPGCSRRGASRGRRSWPPSSSSPRWAPRARATCSPRSRTTCPRCSAVLGVIVVIGVAVDYLVFHRLDRRVRKRRGLLVDAGPSARRRPDSARCGTGSHVRVVLADLPSATFAEVSRMSMLSILGSSWPLRPAPAARRRARTPTPRPDRSS